MKKSTLWFSIICTALCMLLLFALLFLAPRVIAWYVSIRVIRGQFFYPILIAFYCCAVPSGLALFCLMRLLRNIRSERMFEEPNSRLMSIVSWCCLADALITGVAAIYYLPLALLTAAMLFIFLIVRVVRGCFVTATKIQEENSLTI